MRSFYTLSLVLALFTLFFCPTGTHSHRHQTPARHRHVNDLRLDQKPKRDENVVFTFFNDGEGACGVKNSPNDFIVALNSAEYAGGAHCFEMITITIDGKTAQAEIVDECVGCSFGGLDFSQGLFENFAPLGEGELHGSWSYNSDIATSSSATPSESPTASSTSSSVPTTAAPSSTTTSLASTAVPSSTSTTPAAPMSTSQGPQAITQINLALLESSA